MVGTMVRESRYEASIAKTTASASGTKRYRATPDSKNIGANTMQIDRVDTNAGVAICDALSRTISSMSFFGSASRLRLMFSTSTVASSTRMPTARASPPSVMILIVCPIALRTMMEVRIARGMEVAMITVLRQLRSEEHTSELQSRLHLVCRLLLEKKKKIHGTVLSIEHRQKRRESDWIWL